MSKKIAEEVSNGSYSYFNWDFDDDRKKIINNEIFGSNKLIVLDEIHKMSGWKNWLKGVFDKFGNEYKFLVTGSARLDVYVKGGDSMFGRYFYHVIHPFTVAELNNTSDFPTIMEPLTFPKDKEVAVENFKKLINLGGFPEPFIEGKYEEWKRWNQIRNKRVIKEDIRDINSIKEVSKLQLFFDIIPERVGSLFSANSLSKDLQVSHTTVREWLDILVDFYLVYKIHPHQLTKIKSLRKNPKIYLWDWRGVDDLGNRFENLVGSHLNKLVQTMREIKGEDIELKFLRDKESREVDFAVTVDKKIWFVVETKLKDKGIARNLRYFVEREGIKNAYQVIYEEGYDYIKDGTHVISASKFLGGLI